jgi:hypothetical protein
MKHASGLSTKTLREMNDSFFDVAPDGTLIYMDPMIGALKNLKRKVAVKVDGSSRLVLNHEGIAIEVFDLAQGVRSACESAFAAYFKLFRELCQPAEALAA